MEFESDEEINENNEKYEVESVDSDILLAYNQWKLEFEEESEEEFNYSDEEEQEKQEEEEEDYLSNKNNKNNKNNQKKNEINEKINIQNESISSIIINNIENDNDFFLLNDLTNNWRYGGKLSSLNQNINYSLQQQQQQQYELNSNHILGSEFDICDMILLLLNGIPSDLFYCYSNDDNFATKDNFILTPTAQQIKTPNLSRTAVTNLLTWFLKLGNTVHKVRQGIIHETLKKNINFEDSQLQQEENIIKQTSSVFLDTITSSLNSTLRNILSNFEKFINTLQKKLELQSKNNQNENKYYYRYNNNENNNNNNHDNDENNENNNNNNSEYFQSNTLTIIQLYLQLQEWSVIFESTLLEITQTHLKISNSTKNISNVEKFIPLFKSKIQSPYELQDYLHHIHISCLINQLTTEFNRIHLLSTHISTISSNSPLQFLGKSTFKPYNPNPILRECITYQDIYLPCLVSISQAYLKYLMAWIFQNDKKSNISSQLQSINTNRSYSSYSKFGGISYEHLSNITNHSNQNDNFDIKKKLQYLPSIWTPLLKLGLMTKVNMQIFFKQSNIYQNYDSQNLQNSQYLNNLQRRNFISSTEKVIISLQSLFNRKPIQIILPNVNLFTNMIKNNNIDHNENLTLLQKNTQIENESHINLFTSNIIIDKSIILNERNKNHRIIIEPISQLSSLIDIFPSIEMLLTEFCLEPLSDIMKVTQKQVVYNLIGSNLKNSLSYNLQIHFEFMKKLFFIGDSSIFDPLFEFIDDSENFKILLQNSNEKKLYSPKLIIEDVINRIEENIHSILPQHLSENQVSINYQQFYQKNHFSDIKDEQLSLSLSNKSNIIYHLLDSLFIEVHYIPPLNQFFNPDIISIYNKSFNLLIKIQSCIWCGEIVWKHVISMSSPFQNLNIIQNQSPSYELFTFNLKQLFRNCLSSLQSFLHLIRSLKQFYLHEIHVVLFEQLIENLKSCQTVEELLLSHEKYLLKIQSLLSFSHSNIELILIKGLKAIWNLEEMNNLMEIEQQASLYYDSDTFDHSNQMLQSKFKQVLKDFSLTSIEIQTFTDILSEIYLQSPYDENSNILEGKLKYYWANSLKILIGL